MTQINRDQIEKRMEIKISEIFSPDSHSHSTINHHSERKYPWYWNDVCLFFEKKTRKKINPISINIDKS